MSITVLLISTERKILPCAIDTLHYLTIDMLSSDALVLGQLKLMITIEIIMMKLAVKDFLAT